jgi:uncharacterized membrane protein
MPDPKPIAYRYVGETPTPAASARGKRGRLVEPHTIIDWITTAFELAGVGILVVGALGLLAQCGVRVLQRQSWANTYRALRQGLGRTILLSLEVLVAADIIRSVAVDPTLQSVGVLGLLVLVRTFLSWSLEVEITGVAPWRRAATGADAQA